MRTLPSTIDELEERLQQFVLKTIKDEVEEQVSKIQAKIDKKINDLNKKVVESPSGVVIGNLQGLPEVYQTKLAELLGAKLSYEYSCNVGTDDKIDGLIIADAVA